jgi:hypothetical protein
VFVITEVAAEQSTMVILTIPSEFVEMGAVFSASGHVRGKLSGSFVLGPGGTLAVNSATEIWQ